MRSRLPAIAIVVALSIGVAACSGGGSGSGPHAIPQVSNASDHTVSSGAIRSGTVRIARTEEQSQSSARSKQDFTQPSNTTTADPPVPRPNEQPCVVQLFSGYQGGFPVTPNQGIFQYTPPASCPGPWAKVVLDADFSVNAGRQFDRTGSIWLDGTNLYFGTTAEPSRHLGPYWHVERDVTDLSALFQNSGTGDLILGNIVNSTYTGVITVNAKLEFYPSNSTYPAPVVADNVYPLSSASIGGNPAGDNQYITTQQQPLTATVRLPRNVRQAFLDVYLQSQIGDEFWYTCFPNDIAAEFFNCGNTAFREGDVAIDGQAAGVVPVYPWIYTGGIDPYLWRPIPGVETLEFKPYRVNLTPFAGILSDGNQHTVTVNVFNNGNYFAANGALLVYLDHNSNQVTGGIISNATILYPNPSVTNGVTVNSQGVGTGGISVISNHSVSIDGYVNTSAGRIETQVQQQIHFGNVQAVKANTAGTLFDQNINQVTTVTSDTTTISSSGTKQFVHEEKAWPLKLDYKFNVNPDGSALQTAAVSQGKVERSVLQTAGGGMSLRTFLSNTVTSSDTLTFFAAGGYAPSNGQSAQTYIEGNSTGYCYSKSISSQNYILTGQTGGTCPSF